MTQDFTFEKELDRDLGFGKVASAQRQRLVNRNGSFGVTQKIGSSFGSLSLYHLLLTTSWIQFLGIAAVSYLGFNLLFGLAYLGCGPRGIDGLEETAPFLRAFFLAVQTSSTVGYGHLAPANVASNSVMIVQAFFSLVLLACSTGVVFARFSKPSTNLAWSRQAVVAPYKSGFGFMFRIANRRSGQIINLRAKVILTMFVPGNGEVKRSFYELKLERNRVSFFPFSWTIVHPIDEESPLWETTFETFTQRRGEAIVLLQGHDATTSQEVFDWSSYTCDEVVYGARFTPIHREDPEDGTIRFDISRIDELEEA